MSTEFRNTAGQVVAVRFSGGKNGPQVQCEESWTGSGFVEDESGQWCSCSTVTNGATVHPWTPFHTVRRERAFAQARERFDFGPNNDF